MSKRKTIEASLTDVQGKINGPLPKRQKTFVNILLPTNPDVSVAAAAAAAAAAIASPFASESALNSSSFTNNEHKSSRLTAESSESRKNLKLKKLQVDTSSKLKLANSSLLNAYSNIDFTKDNRDINKQLENVPFRHSWADQPSPYFDVAHPFIPFNFQPRSTAELGNFNLIRQFRRAWLIQLYVFLRDVTGIECSITTQDGNQHTRTLVISQKFITIHESQLWTLDSLFTDLFLLLEHYRQINNPIHFFMSNKPKLKLEFLLGPNILQPESLAKANQLPAAAAAAAGVGQKGQSVLKLDDILYMKVNAFIINNKPVKLFKIDTGIDRYKYMGFSWGFREYNSEEYKMKFKREPNYNPTLVCVGISNFVVGDTMFNRDQIDVQQLFAEEQELLNLMNKGHSPELVIYQSFAKQLNLPIVYPSRKNIPSYVNQIIHEKFVKDGNRIINAMKNSKKYSNEFIEDFKTKIKLHAQGLVYYDYNS